MARSKKPYTRVSVYQIEGELNPRTVLRATYLDRAEFEVTAVRVGNRNGFFVGGFVASDRAKWASIVEGWIDSPGPSVSLRNMTAAGVLMLPTADPDAGRVWAICFGMGFHLIEQARMVPDLGRRLAVRTAKPERLRSITHSRLDSRALVARTSLPGGGSFDDFGATDLGDLVSRLVAEASLEGTLASKSGDPVEVRGADSASIPLARTSSAMLKDLDAIEKILEREPVPELAMIEKLRALKPRDPIKEQLEQSLDRALGEDDTLHLGLAWPTEQADEAVPLSHFEVTGQVDGFPSTGNDVGLLLNGLRTLPDTERVARLNRMRVQAFTDEDDVASSLLPARQWLTFEQTLDDGRYCMHDGRWFAVDEGLDELLATQLAPLFSSATPLGGIPPWPTTMPESDYNEVLAAHLGGVCLDAKLVKCASVPRGFESCDVLTPQGTFVHVKVVSRSTGASHLFAQAGLSAQALIDDGTARDGLRQLVESCGGDPEWLLDRPRQAILVMGNNTRLIGPDTLFSFSRMRLARLRAECNRSGVGLSVHPVLRSS